MKRKYLTVPYIIIFLLLKFVAVANSDAVQNIHTGLTTKGFASEQVVANHFLN